MAKKEREYAFDVKLWAVARVIATSEEEARKKMAEELGCLPVDYDNNDVRVTSASIEDSGEDDLVEVDGEDVQDVEDDEENA
jgi:hypothetical protein